MFNRVPDPEAAVLPTVDPSELIPLSHLELDLPRPTRGWDTFLTARGVTVVTDDIGRASISREDARRLLADHAAAEERRRAERAEEMARRFRKKRGERRAPRGVPVPEGMEGVDALTALKAAEAGGQPGELVVHRIPDPNQPREAGEFYRIKHGGAA